MNLQDSVHEYLLQNFENGQLKKVVMDQAKKYYVKNLYDNIYAPMSINTYLQYNNGSGRELFSKMRAVYSSSAFTYNCFGNNTINIKSGIPEFKPGAYAVCFEKQLETLKDTTPANLDVLLASDNEYIFIEVKCTEWLSNNNGYLSEAYIVPDKHIANDTCKIFLPFADRIFDLTSNVNKKGNKRHPTRFRVYDAAQMFKHILGIYNFCTATKESYVCNAPKNVRLVNLVWEPQNIESVDGLKERKQAHEKEFKLFYDAFVASGMQQEFANRGFDFDVLKITFPEMLRVVDLDIEHRHYLRRYA